MSISIDWGDSLGRFESFIDKQKAEMNRRINKMIQEEVRQIVATVKSYTPSRTGRLRNAWKSKRNNKFNFEVENPLDYASYIENGTRYYFPRRMLAKAIAEGAARIQRRLRRLEVEMSREWKK